MILITLITLIAVSALSLRYGTDSRPGFDERRENERFGTLR